MEVVFLPGAAQVDVDDFHEVTIRLHHPVEDPFRRVEIHAALLHPDEEPRQLEGFCDSQDGTAHRIRFLATRPGRHDYTITVGEETFTGRFTAVEAGRKGLLNAEGWHFAWSGTGEPFFWNSTTAYLMAGLREDKMLAAIDRLADAGINRIRVSLCPSRQKGGGRWHEPQVGHREDFSYGYSPWLCARPDCQSDPQPDVTRFDVAYWQKFERLLARARERDMIVQVIFFTDAQEPQNYPFQRPAPKADGAADFDPATRLPDDEEKRYIAYAVARLAAFSNVEWCITNEWALFQSNAWVDEIGSFLASLDPYGHLTSVHGHGHFPFRTSEWCTHALFQVWDEHGGYDWMREQRAAQEATGRIIPQVNEEFGYEDHYPGPWGEGRKAPARAAWTRARLAWEITMAGGCATTGESAASGAGGWINGLGSDDELLTYHCYLRSFFEGLDGWQRLKPRPDIARFCLAEEGVRYILWLPDGAEAPKIPGTEGFLAHWYNPQSGRRERFPLSPQRGTSVSGGGGQGEKALLLEKPS